MYDDIWDYETTDYDDRQTYSILYVRGLERCHLAKSRYG